MKDDLVKKLLKRIVTNIAGQGAEKLIDLLYNKKNVNEFLIAKKLNLTINQTRNILYRLADNGLISFIRKKDKKKGGWYTYFWTLKTEKSLSKYKDKIEEEIIKLREHLKKRETKRFFYCPNCDLEYNEEEALQNDYTCPECGETLEMKESEEILTNLKGEIEKLKSLLSDISLELEQIQNKEQKAREKRLKAEDEKKKEDRAKKRKERKKEKEKLKKKEEKKVKKPKKKVNKKVKKDKKKVNKKVKKDKKKAKKKPKKKKK